MNVTNPKTRKGRTSWIPYPMKLMTALILFFTLTQSSYGQTYTMQISNCTAIGTDRAEFDLLMANTGTAALKLNAVVLRYTHAATAGTFTTANFTAGFVPNTSPNTWNQGSPGLNWPEKVGVTNNFSYTAATRQVSWSSNSTYWSAATAPSLPIGGAAVNCGRFFIQLTNGATFNPNSLLGLANAATMAATVYIGTSAVSASGTKTLLAPCSLTVNVPSNTCPTAANASGTVDPTCFGGTGSTNITLTPAPLPLGGTYSVDGGLGTPFTTNPFSVSGLSQGSHTITVTNTGCSEVSTTVTIAGPSAAPTSTDNITNCGAYVWNTANGDGQSYAASGTYTWNNPNVNGGGCPGVSTLVLTVNTADNHTDIITNCGSYVWPTDNQSYGLSGTYTTATNVNGCSGVATLVLTVNTGSNPTTTATECSSYLWSEDNQSYTVTGTYTAATNVNGCPGVATLNLTILGGHMVLATAGNAASTLGTATASNTIVGTPVLFEVGCDYAAMISSPGAGATSVTATVVGSNPVGPFGQVYAPRYFDVAAAIDQAGSVTLYATAADFAAYNAACGSLFPMSPATVKIAQVVGGLAGTVTPVATSAVWNPVLSRYEISGSVSALNTSYYLYTDPQCALTMSSISASAITSTSATLNWTAVPGASSYEVRLRLAGTNDPWHNATSSTLSRGMQGIPGGVYEVQGKVRCSSTTSGIWGPLSTFTLSASACAPASNLAATNVTTTTVLMTWSVAPLATQYVLQFRPVTTNPSPWMPVGGNSGTSRLLQGLASGQQYEVQIQSFCPSIAQNNGKSVWSTSVFFTTIANPCTVPTNIQATAVTSTGTTITWDVVPNATSYTLRFRKSAVGPTPAGPWSNAGCPTNSRILTGLTPNTSYDVEVMTNCGTTQTAWSATMSFTTGVVLRPTTEPVSLTAASTEFNVYPNPTTDMINVELTAYQAQTTTVKVYDLTGRLMKQVVSQTEAGVQKIEVSLGEIASGVYTVQVYENDKLTHISRVRKND